MNAERVGSLFWMTFGGATVYGALELGLGEVGQPGSGFLAFVAGCFVVLMATLVMFQSFRTDCHVTVTLNSLWHGLKWQRAIAVTILIAIFIAVFDRLGFFICSFVLLVAIMRWLEGLSWKISLLVPAGTVALTFILFKTIFKISLPAGILGF